MIAWWKQFWKNHGTKVIGFGSSIIGAVSFLDATTIHLLEETFGPHRGHQISSVLLIIGGIGTAWRGFTNSHRSDP